MKISEVITKLLEIEAQLGDVDVYIGSHYMDLPIVNVEFNADFPIPYPLIYNDDLHK
jgi:hypothetical protein